MRALVERSLQDDGFVVESVPSSRRAIREFEAIDPDVLVTDIDLGERPNGVELATLLRAQAPYLGVVFLTNYTSMDAIESKVTPPEHAAFVHKGSIEETSQLRLAIDSALDDSSEALVLAAKGDDDPVARLSATQLSVLKQIADVPDVRRGAQFVCKAVAVFPDGTEVIASGTVEGEIVRSPRGTNGFGYDPIFQPLDSQLTTAQMSADQKDQISHRGKALRDLANQLAKVIS